MTDTDTEQIRRIAREEAQRVYQDIAVTDSDGRRWSLPQIADRISALAPDLERREVLQTSVVVIGYIGAGYSITTAALKALSEPASANAVGELGTTADPLSDLHTAGLDGGGSAVSVGDDLDGGSSQSLTNWSSLDVEDLSITSTLTDLTLSFNGGQSRNVNLDTGLEGTRILALAVPSNDPDNDVGFNVDKIARRDSDGLMRLVVTETENAGGGEARITAWEIGV